jgi:hypothetical protein
MSRILSVWNSFLSFLFCDQYGLVFTNLHIFTFLRFPQNMDFKLHEIMFTSSSISLGGFYIRRPRKFCISILH